LLKKKKCKILSRVDRLASLTQGSESVLGFGFQNNLLIQVKLEVPEELTKGRGVAKQPLDRGVAKQSLDRGVAKQSLDRGVAKQSLDRGVAKQSLDRGEEKKQ
jgi:hypothetical protein